LEGNPVMVKEAQVSRMDMPGQADGSVRRDAVKSEPKLCVRDVHVRLGTNAILTGICADIADGEIVALLGRSGSGKSTLLRAIAGLETPTGGSIRIGARTVFDAAAHVNVPPEKRDLGLVFQSYALWPHKTVWDNVAYGLVLRNVARDEITRRVREVLAGVGLAEYGERYPSQLSGGQQQRVALARALVYRPPLLLLDEPLSNLDAKLREEARVWIREIIKSAGLTAIFVTHDQVEAMAIADRIMLLKDGAMVQEGTPEQLYTAPGSLFAADFMGINNSFDARITSTLNGQARLDIGGVALWGRNKAERSVGETATAVIRIECVRLAEASSENAIAAELAASAYLGGRWEHVFRVANRQLRVLTEKPLAPGVYHLTLPRENLWIF
jgi:iron(III) transport system ATP-binding protein